MNRRNWLQLSRKLVDQTDLDYTITAFNGALEQANKGFFGEGVRVTTMYPTPFIVTLSGVVLGGSVGNGFAYDPNGQPVEITPSTPTSKAFTVPPNSSGNPRWDLLVLRYAQTGDTPVPKPSDPITTINLNLHDDFVLAVIAGTPAPSPVYPAKGVNDIILDGLQVPTGATLGTSIVLDESIREIALPFIAELPTFVDEVPTGVIDGSNKTFILSGTPLTSGSLLVYVDDLKLRPSEFSIAGSTITLVVAPALGQDVQAWYVEANPMSQNPLTGFDTEVGTGDGVTDTFTFSGVPVSKPSTQVYVDGTKLQASEWDLVMGTTTSDIKFHAGSIPGAGQSIDVVFFVDSKNAGVGPSTSGVQTVSNDGTGVGQVLKGIAGNNLGARNIKAGAGATVNQIGDDIVIGASGGGGTGAYAPSGSPGSPVTINPAVSIAVTSDQRQLQFIRSTSGAQAMTANPQIWAGTVVGQELMLIGTSDINYVSLADGTGLSLNGAINLKNNQTLPMIWNGLVWVEISRR